LHRISLQLHDSSHPAFVALSSSDFIPARSDVWINALWFTSLVIALISALVAIFVKQWAREYLSWTTSLPGRDSVALRQFRYASWKRWDVQRWRDVVATLLQLGLVLFFGGLIILLWQLNKVVAGLVTVTAGFSIGCLLVSIVLPVLYRSCPYRSALSWSLRRPLEFIILRIARLLKGVDSEFIRQITWLKHRCSWTHRDFDTMGRRSDVSRQALDGVLDVLRARPSLRTLDDISPCLYTLDLESPGIDPKTVWAVIVAALNLELVPQELLVQQPATYWELHIAIPRDLAWGIAALSRQVILVWPTVRVEDNAELPTHLVHFVTAMATTTRVDYVVAYHFCTLVRLLSINAPEELSEAAWKDINENASMGDICRMVPSDKFTEFMAGRTLTGSLR
jgi:hypothetical protein